MNEKVNGVLKYVGSLEINFLEVPNVHLTTEQWESVTERSELKSKKYLKIYDRNSRACKIKLKNKNALDWI